MKKELYIPFDSKGNMLVWTNAVYPAVQPSANPYWGAVASWRNNRPFNARLHISEFSRGRSAAQFIWKDTLGHEYYMFGQYLTGTLQGSTCLNGWIDGLWGFIKRGANYSIVKL